MRFKWCTDQHDFWDPFALKSTLCSHLLCQTRSGTQIERLLGATTLAVVRTQLPTLYRACAVWFWPLKTEKSFRVTVRSASSTCLSFISFKLTRTHTHTHVMVHHHFQWVSTPLALPFEAFPGVLWRWSKDWHGEELQPTRVWLHHVPGMGEWYVKQSPEVGWNMH